MHVHLYQYQVPILHKLESYHQVQMAFHQDDVHIDELTFQHEHIWKIKEA